MNSKFKAFLQSWIVTTLSVIVAEQVLDGIHADSLTALVAASLVLGVLNALLRPVMILISLPLLIVTFGLFTFVINAVLLGLVSLIVRPFHVDGFWAAFWGALIISIVGTILNILTGANRKQKPPAPPRNPPPSSGGPGGPIIDV